MANPSKPKTVVLTAIRESIREGLLAVRQSLAAMTLLELAMLAVVILFYQWPAATSFLTRFAEGQQRGGILTASLATAVAGGILSEISLVYLQDKGRWTRAHVENMAFKFVMFFINGAMVYEFYRLQAFWFGNGTSVAVLTHKVIVDQFAFTLVWSLPYQTFMTRWQALGFSGSRLWRELNLQFVLERMLPILITNWMFWIPGVVLIYALPQMLQSTLFIFATAIWGLLLPAVARQRQHDPATPPILHTPLVVTNLAE